jgi:hypothetical protein
MRQGMVTSAAMYWPTIIFERVRIVRKRRVKGNRWCLLLVCVLVSLVLTGPSTSGAATTASRLYLVKSPIYFDASAPAVAVPLVAVDFSGKGAVVTSVVLRIGQGQTKTEGRWRVLPVAAPVSSEKFDAAWKLFAAPGIREGGVVEWSDFLSGIFINNAEAYDAILVTAPAPDDIAPGKSYSISVEATLDSGDTITATGLAIVQSITPPSGWIRGDTHIHSDLGVATLSLKNIASWAESNGHSYTYVTDHIDLIRVESRFGSTPDQCWSGWWNQFPAASTSSYTSCPGIEVTAKDANGDGRYDGDALGYRMPSTNPTAIDNKTLSCTDLTSTIQQASSGASAFVAHPSGSPSWSSPGCGYDGIQTVPAGDTFWRNSITTYPYCSAAASGGSDAHYGIFLNTTATWIYAPNWSSASTWSAKVDAVAAALKTGKTTATTDGSFAFFSMGGNYPGSSLTLATGSTVYYNVTVQALNNGQSVRVAWDFYRGATRINGTTTAANPSGYSYTWSNISTTVQTGKNGYYLTVRFDYLNADGTVAFSSYAYCGPTYITGN